MCAGESRVTCALCVCANVHAFLRCQRAQFGPGKLFRFLTQGRMSSPALFSSLPHRCTAFGASIFHAVFYPTLHLCQMRLRPGLLSRITSAVTRIVADDVRQQRMVSPAYKPSECVMPLITPRTSADTRTTEDEFWQRIIVSHLLQAVRVRASVFHSSHKR